MESKIRILVQNLEKKSFVSLAHVNPSSYDNRDFLDSQTASSQSPSDPCSTRWFIGITFDQNALTTTNVDLTYEIQSFSQTGIHLQVTRQFFENVIQKKSLFVRTKIKTVVVSTDRKQKKQIGFAFIIVSSQLFLSSLLY